MNSEYSPYINSNSEHVIYRNETEQPKSKGYSKQTYMYIGIAIVLVLLVVWYFYKKNIEGFLSSGIRSDPQHDDTYLEKQIDKLNKMQNKNLNSM